ncbi:hypothetical protein appser11_3980 [Actinobacillus pleuropneumoniae serovar 11 str. 56153]|nr:hypothetical protein appser9_3880 [Actinobacillus pleuropneumoniae serovar 9 str. CVJ13261]EFM99109.1 hypothetical protein appser11_3980 [Actinobacillus pleuropneumoniae serovar 11 str. 56153]EFN01192.1 hypothetical protein appser12_4050 [Actinobacillus pleuropneumoniae serovar 12 str. 1096]
MILLIKKTVSILFLLFFVKISSMLIPFWEAYLASGGI